MSDPTAATIPRAGRGTSAPESSTEPAVWSDVAARLRDGSGTTWLSVAAAGGVHTRPVFASWTGSTFVLASNPGAAKTRRLEQTDGTVSLAIDLGSLHLVVEGTAARLTDEADLERASTAMRDVYDWPTEVDGDLLDAPYAAPTSGGPPFQVWEVTPVKTIALPTQDQVAPTRFTFG
ncbi:hypothetical protein [Nocardioides sp.]|uniref:pyridoxamine 5'-phosphate oxidase family protein n=1 Tax=Nocardioides sp. TaxID=35761 RepID=UPI002716BBF4|nr:hypothetical protein [Nocardioides sp.]MDO9457809.1 hypothetical protein [Nocardioides sp.]